MSQEVVRFGPRVRTQQLAQPELLHATILATSKDGIVSVIDDYFMTVPASLIVMHDVVTKDYTKRVRLGEIISNPMTWSKETYVAVQGTRLDKYYLEQYAGFTSRSDHSGICTYLRWSQSWPPAKNFSEGRAYHYQHAVNRVYEKAQAATFSAIVDLFELPETIGMLKQLVHRLKTGYGVFKVLPDILRVVGRRALRNLRRPRRLYNVLGLGRRVEITSITGLWLEWRFGWSPLIKSLYDLCEALENSLSHDKPPRITYRATQSFDYKDETSENRPISYLSGASAINAYVTTISEYKGQVRAGIIMRHPGLSLAKEFGFRAADLPSAVWDLVPFSFVVDRLLHVSSWLNAIQARNCEILAAWAVERSTRTTTYRLEPVSGSQSSGSGSTAKRYEVTRSSNSFTHTVELVQRTVNVSPSTLPLLDTDFSTFSNLRHSLDHIALIIGQLRTSAGRRF